jgi:ElaB/YqjD/DUF883 family membrane-anchored ribosome-binding protein
MDEAGRHLHDYADDATNGAGRLLDRGRRHARRNARQVAELAEDLGDQARYQARRLQRQVQRHPLAAVGIVAAVVGIGVLVLATSRARRRRREAAVMPPDHDYFPEDETVTDETVGRRDD